MKDLIFGGACALACAVCVGGLAGAACASDANEGPAQRGFWRQLAAATFLCFLTELIVCALATGGWPALPAALCMALVCAAAFCSAYRLQSRPPEVGV
jgi:hypothetical protein